MEELEAKATAGHPVTISQATKLQRGTPAIRAPLVETMLLLTTLFTTVATQVLKKRGGVARWHVDINVVLPLQQTGRLVPHGAKQGARCQCEAQAVRASVIRKGTKEVVAALRSTRGWLETAGRRDTPCAERPNRSKLLSQNCGERRCESLNDVAPYVYAPGPGTLPCKS